MPPTSPKPAPGPQNTFPLDLDKVSLEQALRDFEIANARVLDLTQRLIASERRRSEVENELQELKLAHAAAQQQSLTSSRTVKWAVGVATGLARRLLKSP
jgi:hypothetical protein